MMTMLTLLTYCLLLLMQEDNAWLNRTVSRAAWLDLALYPHRAYSPMPTLTRPPCHTVLQVVAKEEGLRTEQSMRIQLEASVSKK